ncbi:MAG: leucyl/phenylalanyl-tRNA--protein transferase [Ilumatobacteraceae bacterium]|nr:leucyl/phenylalanyl-tRNA--protein transferase [Ilumatobacteraceae bacterium]
MSCSGPQDSAPVEPEPSKWVLPSDGPTDDSALVAIGGDLEPGTLLTAYRMGLFPMPVPRRRIGWFSPDPRGILPLDQLVISRSLRRSLRRYNVSRNEAFTEVVTNCADPRRPSGWIDRSIVEAYTTLHQLGWAHSIEVWDDDRLVGGLYGVRIHGFFAGESMFHHATDASKVALVHLVDWFQNSHGKLLDVQWTTDHLSSLGAVDIARHDYLQLLKDAVLLITRKNDAS